jgi:hypothetical protein
MYVFIGIERVNVLVNVRNVRNLCSTALIRLSLYVVRIISVFTILLSQDLHPSVSPRLRYIEDCVVCNERFLHSLIFLFVGRRSVVDIIFSVPF